MSPVVVSNTTPLNYLVLIGAAELLPRLHTNIHIAREVSVELARTRAPLVVRDWIATPPSWLKIHDVNPEKQSDGPDFCRSTRGSETQSFWRTSFRRAL